MHMEINVDISLKGYAHSKVGFNIYIFVGNLVVILF
jgi:hypothetical protein